MESNYTFLDASKTLKMIRKSEKNIKKASLLLSQYEVHERIKKFIAEKDTKDDKQSTLSTREKIRYGKIGDSFIRGGEDYFKKLTSDIKKEEKKKFKEKKKQLKDAETKNKLNTKDPKKKIKATNKIKWILLSAAFVGIAFGIKKLMDVYKDYSRHINIHKSLNEILPQKVQFHSGAAKTIEDEQTSFSLTTQDGTEMSLSEDKYGKNPVEDAAHNFDDILIVEMLKNGFGKFINNIENGTSVVGYMVFKPLETFLNAARIYIYDGFTNPKIPKLYKDACSALTSLSSSFSTMLDNLNKPIKLSYTHLRLTSQNEYRQRVENVRTNIEILVNKGNQFSTLQSGWRTANLHLTLNEPPVAITEKFEALAKSSYKEFETRRRDLIKSVDSLKIDWAGGTGGDYTFAATPSFKLSDDVPENGITMFLGMQIKWDGGSHTIGRSWIPGRQDEKNQEAIEDMLNIVRADANKAMIVLRDDIRNFLETQLVEMRALSYYEEYVIKPKEAMMDIVKTNVAPYYHNFQEKYVDDIIFNKKDVPTKDKLNELINSYFSNQNPKETNFILKYLHRMENSLDAREDYIHNIFYRFKTYLNPFHTFFDEYTDQSNFDVDKKNDLIFNAMKSSKTITMGEYSDSITMSGISDDYITKSLNDYMENKISLKQELVNILENIVSENFDLLKKAKNEIGVFHKIDVVNLHKNYDANNNRVNSHFELKTKNDSNNQNQEIISIENVKLGKISHLND